jgi:hypothetical protein
VLHRRFHLNVEARTKVALIIWLTSLKGVRRKYTMDKPQRPDEDQDRPPENSTEKEAEGTPSEESNELDGLSHQFSARIEGLRELLEVISPHVAALDRPEGIEGTIDQSGLSEHGKEVLRDVFISGFGPEAEPRGEGSTQSESNGEESERDGAAVSMSPDQTIEVKGSGQSENPAEVSELDGPVPLDEAPPEVKAFVDVAVEEPSGVLKVLRRMTQGIIAPRVSLLHGSLLTVAVASFEFLLAGLFSHHLITYPKQLKDDEREFSLADLVELGSIEEARRVLVERRVDGFMRRAVDDWSRWSKKTLGEAFDELCIDFAHLNEVFQRRHVIVHSGGAVSRLYIERVDLSTEDCPKLGENLPVSASYMQSALDELEVLGHGLIALARSKWTPSDPGEASVQLNTKIFDLLQARRWKSARKLALVGESLGQPDSDRWMIVVNGWLAAKRDGEFDVCRASVVDWDVSALANRFKLARACLLDEVDEAFDLLALTLAEPKRKPGHMWEWPLFDDLRSDPRFADAFVQAGYTPRDHALDVASSSDGGASSAQESNEPLS